MPRRLALYLLRETAGLYLYGVAAVCLLLSIDMLTVWAEFLIAQEASPGTVVRLMLYRLPQFLRLALPVAVVFAVLLATGRLARDSELKASYASGVAPLRLLLPLLGFAVGISGLTLVNNGLLEPISQRAYDRLVDSFYYTRPPPEVQTDASFQVPGQGVYFAARLRQAPEERSIAELSGVLVIAPDGTSYSATSGRWDADARTWRLDEAERVGPDGTPERIGELVLPFDLEVDPETTVVDADTLSLPALWRQLRAVEAAGGQVRQLSFDLHRRVADAFSAVVFVLVAGTLGLHLRDRSSGFAWTIVLLVLFYVIWTLASDLFDSGVLAPVVAAWLTPVVVGVGSAGLALWRFRT